MLKTYGRIAESKAGIATVTAVPAGAHGAAIEEEGAKAGVRQMLAPTERVTHSRSGLQIFLLAGNPVTCTSKKGPFRKWIFS